MNEMSDCELIEVCIFFTDDKSRTFVLDNQTMFCLESQLKADMAQSDNNSLLIRGAKFDTIFQKNQIRYITLRKYSKERVQLENAILAKAIGRPLGRSNGDENP